MLRRWRVDPRRELLLRIDCATSNGSLSSFLGDKTVSIDPKEGLVIRADHTQEVLRERSLSSGEFHLLLLMVAALVTRRRGTVIAIDEPDVNALRMAAPANTCAVRVRFKRESSFHLCYAFARPCSVVFPRFGRAQVGSSRHAEEKTRGDIGRSSNG